MKAVTKRQCGILGLRQSCVVWVGAETFLNREPIKIGGGNDFNDYEQEQRHHEHIFPISSHILAFNGFHSPNTEHNTRNRLKKCCPLLPPHRVACKSIGANKERRKKEPSGITTAMMIMMRTLCVRSAVELFCLLLFLLVVVQSAVYRLDKMVYMQPPPLPTSLPPQKNPAKLHTLY